MNTYVMNSVLFQPYHLEAVAYGNMSDFELPEKRKANNIWNLEKTYTRAIENATVELLGVATFFL